MFLGDLLRRRTQYRRGDQLGLRVCLSQAKFSEEVAKKSGFRKSGTVLLGPNGDLSGYIELHGSAEQLAAVREDEEFQRNTINAGLIVDRLRHLDGVTNEQVARQMALYQDSLARVPQNG